MPCTMETGSSTLPKKRVVGRPITARTVPLNMREETEEKSTTFNIDSILEQMQKTGKD
jgi:hypothetical protein